MAGEAFRPLGLCNLIYCMTLFLEALPSQLIRGFVLFDRPAAPAAVNPAHNAVAAIE